jgi:anti-sigma-K factor RskA
MTPERTPDEVRELLGAYALDALESDERRQVDELLLTDASARAELHELEHAAAWLGHASLRPPESAWDSIAAEVDRDLAADPADPADTPVAADPDSEVVAPIPLRPRPRRVSQWLVAAAAVVILAIGAVGVFALVSGSTSSSKDPASEALARAVRNPKARTTILRSKDGRYSAVTAVLPDGTGYLSSAAMPSVPTGRDLQLWSITPDGAVSLGVMRGHSDLHTFRVLPGTKELAITSEPRGGSTAPTGNPIVSGNLPAV